MNKPTPFFWMPIPIGDHLARTAALTPAEDSAFMRLQFFQWQYGHFREEQILVIGRFSADAWSIAQASLMHMLNRDPDGLLFFPWLDQEKGKWAEKHRKAVEKAQKAAKTRWANKEKAKGERPTKPMLGASLEHSSSNAGDDARDMPFTFTSKNLSPSLRSGDPQAAGLGGPALNGSNGHHGLNGSNGSNGHHGAEKAKTPKKPAVASKPELVGSSASTRHQSRVGLQSATSSVSSPLIAVTQAEARKPTLGDSRFLPFKGVIVRWWSQLQNRPAEEVPWGGRDNAELKRMLEAEPHLSIEDLAERLEHRWTAVQRCSEHPIGKGNVSAAAPLYQVMSRLVSYSHGPVNDLGGSL